MESVILKRLRAPMEYLKRSRDEEFLPEPYRTEFDRDRDRILYSKAFRRLKGKTQVFLSTGADHLRTRLTHTLEVSQISRIIAYNLNLDGILTEAIALGHDLGHTPFGHVGERTLNQIMSNCDILSDFQNQMEPSDKGFKHNWQSLRVLCDLEMLYGKPGVNLTNFTLWGILNHSNPAWKKCSNYSPDTEKNCYLHRDPKKCEQATCGYSEVGFYQKYLSSMAIDDVHPAWSFEGFIVALADEIAQRHHDMQDALNIGIVDREELIQVLDKHYKEFYSGKSKQDSTTKDIFKKLKDSTTDQEFLPYLSKFVVNFYTNQLIGTSKKNLEVFIRKHGVSKRIDFIQSYPSIDVGQAANVIGFTPTLHEQDIEIQKFLRNRILNSHKAQQMDGKGRFVIRQLFKAYLTNPRQLFDSTILAVFKNYGEQFSEYALYDKQEIGKLRDEIDSPHNKSNQRFQTALLRAICDNISGMTDDFALTQHENLYG